MVKLFVGNLVEDIDQGLIKSMFDEFGKVDECDVLGKFGFVHMSDESEANMAIKNLNGRIVQGRKMNVEVSTSTARKSGGRGGFGRGGAGGGSTYGGRGRGGRDGAGRGRGGRGSFRGALHSAERFAPYGRRGPSSMLPMDDYSFDAYQERRLAVAAAALREFDERMSSRSFSSPLGGDPYARPPPEYYNDRVEGMRSGGFEDFDAGYDDYPSYSEGYKGYGGGRSRGYRSVRDRY